MSTFRAAAAPTTGSTPTRTITIPAGAVVGDAAILIAGVNGNNTPTVSGHGTWAQRGSWSTIGTTLSAGIFYSIIAAGDAGTAVNVVQTGSAKIDLMLLVYKQTSTSSPFDVATSAVNTFTSGTSTSTYVAPTTLAANTTGALALEVILDRGSPSSTALTKPAGWVLRSSVYDTGGGAVSMAVAEAPSTTNSGSVAGGDSWTMTPSPSSIQHAGFTLLLRPSAVPPTAGFTSTVAGLVATFTNTSTATPPATLASYAWVFGDGATSTSASPAHTYAAAGSYAVTLTTTDSFGVTSAVSRTVVAAGPTAAFTVALVGPRVTFDGTASAPTAPATISGYAWDFGDGATGTGSTATHKYTAGGTVTTSLTVTDSNGATNTTTQSVTIAPPGSPVLPVAVTAAGWTASAGTLLACLSDTDQSTLIASPTPPTASLVTVVYGWAIPPAAGQGMAFVWGADRLGSSSGTVTGRLYTDHTASTLISTVTGVTVPDGTASGLSVLTAPLLFIFPAVDIAGVTDWSEPTVVYSNTAA